MFELFYTTRSGFIQFFQIILLAISLGLQSYAIQVDMGWQRTLNKTGKDFVCPWLIKKVDVGMYNEYASMADNLLHHSHADHHHYTEDHRYFRQNIGRGSGGEETSAIILLILSITLLSTHLVLACVSKNYLYRTKWTAVVQGIVIFACGFAGMLIAISANTYETLYTYLANKFPECILLHVCYNKIYENHKEIMKYLHSKDFVNGPKHAKKVQEVLEKNHVCQKFDYKIAAAGIAGVMILLSFIIICNAMDLTTIYDEEDVDDDERKRRQAFHLQALQAKRRMHGKKSQMNITDDDIQRQRSITAGVGVVPTTSDAKA